MDASELDQQMARLAEGDRSAFAAVFRELWPRVRALCISLVPNRDDAEDAAQQAMEKVLTRASDYDPKRPALAWALGIAAWESRTVTRWRQRRREVGVEESGELPGRTNARTLEEEFIGHELERAVLTAAGHLLETDRAELVKAYLEEAQAGAPAARKRRQRALDRLRMVFRRLYGTD